MEISVVQIPAITKGLVLTGLETIPATVSRDMKASDARSTSTTAPSIPVKTEEVAKI